MSWRPNLDYALGWIHVISNEALRHSTSRLLKKQPNALVLMLRILDLFATGLPNRVRGYPAPPHATI